MKNKKLISLILAIILCFSATLLVVTANAKSVSIEVMTDASELNAGEVATVSVKVATNFPVATMSIPVFYDKTLVSVSEATTTLGDYSVCSTTTDAESVDSSKIYANTGISEEEFGFVLVNYIGSAGSQVSQNIDDIVLTFKITAKADVDGDAIIKCVAQSAKTSGNVAGMLYFGSTSSDMVINSVPENVDKIDVTNATQTVKITSVSEPNTLILKEDAPYEAYIDLNNNNKGEYTGTIYGIDTLGCNDSFEADGMLADFLTTAYGDDYLEIIVSASETTGTVINVLDNEGEVVESYMFIYFGDVDMDGWVGTSDAFVCEYYEIMGEGIYDLPTFMAGDLDGDAFPGSSDAFTMEYFEIMGEGMPLQTEVGSYAIDLYFELL